MPRKESFLDSVISIMAEGSSIVATADDLNTANVIRKHIMSRGNKLWVYVMKNKEGRYDVSVANEWGMQVPPGIVIVLKEESLKILALEDITDDAVELSDAYP